MAEQLDLFPDHKDWDEALTDYCEEQIKEYLDKNAYYAIYEDPFTTELLSIGPFDNEDEAGSAMSEYDGEMVIKCNGRELEVFLKHNNKRVVQ